MTESDDDVLHKLDALFKKHADAAPDIPVLTDFISDADLNLDAIPVLTEEVPPLNPASVLHAPEIELELVPEPIRSDPVLQQAETSAMLARLAAVEAEIQADVDARIAKAQATRKIVPSIEIPKDASYVSLPPAIGSAPPPPVQPVTQASETQAKQIADLIQAEISRSLKTSLHSTLAEELDGMLISALDKAVSSMLEQFMVHMEEVVRAAIIDELRKQGIPPAAEPPHGN